jgi:hypothetical protein
MIRHVCRGSWVLFCALAAFACRPQADDEDDDQGTGGSRLLVDQTSGGAGAGGAPASDTTESVQTCPAFEGLDSTCLADSRVAKPQAVNMLLVIDKSGSMDDQATYKDRTKWEAMTAALSSALEDTLEDPNISANLAFGLELFPRQDLAGDCQAEDCCAMADTPVNVDVTPASTSVPLVVDALEASTPSGLTPTADALEAALAYYATGQGSTLRGHKYVLLATDGGPNCNDQITCTAAECTQNLDQACGSATENCCDTGVMYLWCVDHARTVERIGKLADVGVKTIVVGIPGSEAYREWLNAFADAGGAPAPETKGARFYEVSSAAGLKGLEQTFRQITQHLVHSCEIQLSEQPASYSNWLVNVAIGCTLVPQSIDADDDDSPAGSAGARAGAVENWRIDESTSPVTIQLLGDYCQRVERGVDRVDIIVNCPILR